MELNFKTLASAYLNVLEGYDFIIPEDVPANERTAFHGAAAAAHKSGKSHFDFGGKKYPVTMKKDAAKAINSDTQKEAKEDEPEASTEVDGNDEKEAGMKKVPCPKCEGKGCAHCDEKGYHMSKVESSHGSNDKKSTKESVEEETELNELSAEEKKLVNQMYDKKGNLTPLGKKVMNHGKKPGDKGYVENTNEEVEQVDEISRSMTPMRNKFGGTVIPKKFDAYKKHMKTHKLDEPTVHMIHQNPDEPESKRMMKNPKYAKAMDLYKAAHKNESVDEVLDTPKAMQSYKNKAKASYDKATSSAAAKILRGKDKDGNRADHRPELKTMDKRKKGMAAADMVAVKRTFDALRGNK